ncbi:MAG: sensor histidine kinase [Flavobacteriaceae bacterium]
MLNNVDLPVLKEAKVLYFSGYLSKISDNDSLFFIYSNQAYNRALIIKDSLTVLHSLSALSQTRDYTNDFPYNLEYLDLLEKKSEEYDNEYFKIAHRFLKGNYYLFRDKNKEAIDNYKLLLDYEFTKKDSIFLLKAYSSIGTLYQANLYLPDSAIYYYQKKLALINSKEEYQYGNNYFSTYLNLGSAYNSKKEYQKAEYYYLMADSNIVNTYINYEKYQIKEYLSDVYFKQNKFDKAYLNLLESNAHLDSLNKNEHREAVANIKEKYDNEKLRGDNLESEAKRKQNRNLFYGAVILLFFGGITTTLFLKNSKRKRLLAEKNNVIEQQKVVTLLKEQELTSIDAMIEGQEKERKRIAEDLHDDLGSVLTTLKLHFENYKLNKDKKKFSENELIEKTDDLLDEAYTKVRSMAHAKNSGVIANQGLLVAIENMAEKVSSSKKIEISVLDHGLENRLENSLELTIFRIIQELITNIIKHAAATEATIHLTNHDNSLNIMVEDNGVGFDTNHISNKGMGIHSIDKRIEHLDGTMTIESELNKGTTVIIDIPI